MLCKLSFPGSNPGGIQYFFLFHNSYVIVVLLNTNFIMYHFASLTNLTLIQTNPSVKYFNIHSTDGTANFVHSKNTKSVGHSICFNI